MSDTETLEQPTQTQVEQPDVQATPDASQIMAESLWSTPSIYQNVEQPVTPDQVTNTDPAVETNTPTAAEDQNDVIGVDDYFQREFGMNEADFRNKWTDYNTPKEPVQPEFKWENEESKRFFDYLKEGKEDDIYNYLNQKKQLERLEKYDVADANQAAEIIRANLQFKYKDLSSSEIDRLFTRQYSMPAKPTQSLDQTDDEYGAALQSWENQVKEKQQDMIIDAKLAKPELANFKSQIVLPDIKPVAQSNEPTPEELAVAQQRRDAYFGSLESSIKSFGDVKMNYKDKEVELPLSFTVTNEQKEQVKNIVEGLYTKWDYFMKKWGNEDGSFNTSKMAEDIYWLENGKMIAQNLVNDAGAQRLLHETKVRNNINLNGVNQAMGPTNPTQQAPKNESQVLAEKIWSM